MPHHWKKEWTAWKNAALDFIYPPIHPCPVCHRQDVPLREEWAGLCPDCFTDFPWMEEDLLPDGVTAPAHYREGGRALVARLKYQEGLYLAPVMAAMMARKVTEMKKQDPNWVVVPVPMHRKRERHRGYNQAKLLARHMAFMVEFSYESQALHRRRETAPMHRLNRLERVKNLTGSIFLSPGGKEKLAGRRVMLVDDIYTTGATAEACAEAMRSAGVLDVQVVAFAVADLEKDE